MRARRDIDRMAALEAASRLFASEGLGAPMAAISRESGLSLTALYEAFENKDALVAETVDHVFRRNLLPALEAADDETGDPTERMEALIDRILTAMEADREYIVFYIEARAHRGADPGAFERCIEIVLEKVGATFAAVRAAGRAPGLSPENFAVALIASLVALTQAQMERAPDASLTDLAPEVHAIFTPLLNVEADSNQR